MKAGHVAEAGEAAEHALALGTPDASILFHAGMVAKAQGNLTVARERLTRALKLSPSFDALQAPVARAALAGL